MRESKQKSSKENEATKNSERERVRLKTLLVFVVVTFWLTIALQVVLFFIQDGRANFILLSIISGMMVLGVVLKMRYQKHLKKRVSE